MYSYAAHWYNPFKHGDPVYLIIAVKRGRK